jgi:hypothetical protein
MVLLILVFQFKVDYDIRGQAPSDKWSKEVTISKGNVTTFPKLVKSENNNIVAFNNGDKLQIVVTDELGLKIKEKTFETGAVLVKEVNLLKAQEFFYLSYNSYDNGANCLKIIKLDKELKELEQTKIENITNTYQIGEDILIIGYKDKIEVLNMTDNSKLNLNVKAATLFSGVKTKSGFMFTYCDGEEGFSYITVEGGVASDPKLAGVLKKSGAMTFIRTASSSDNINGYLLIEYSVQGDFVGTRILTFALDGSAESSSDLYIENNKHIYNVIGDYSKDGARFLATTDRILGVKNYQQDIVDFILKDNKVISYSYVSRLHGISTYPAINGDTIAYSSYIKNKEYGIYLASQNEQFKKVNNIPLKVEREQAALNTLQGFVYSLIYIIYPIKWIIPVTLLICIMTFLSYSFNDKKKKLFFILISIVTFVLKTSGILSNSYGDKMYLLPQVLAHKWVSLLISLIISALCYSFGYKLYKEDLDGMAISYFFIALAIDTVLTMMIFVPFFMTV